jgi:hypothetical protein
MLCNARYSVSICFSSSASFFHPFFMAKERKVAARTRAAGSSMYKFAMTPGSRGREEFIFDWKQRRAERREIARHEQAESASFGQPLKAFTSFE